MSAVVRYMPWRLLAVLSVLAGLFFWLVGEWRDEQGWFVNTSQDVGFVLEDIQITGLERTDRIDVLAQLDVDLGMPIMSIDLSALVMRVESLPWVSQAIAQRQLPGVLQIKVIERQPFALWQQEGALALIDSTGVVITTKTLDRFANLPLVVGDGADVASYQFMLMLDSVPDLAARVRSAVRVGDRRWDVIMNNGVRIKLPQAPRSNRYDAWNEAAAWARVADMQLEHSILEREIEVIDLRDPARVTFRLTEAGKRGLATMQFET